MDPPQAVYPPWWGVRYSKNENDAGVCLEDANKSLVQDVSTNEGQALCSVVLEMAVSD